MRRLAFAGAFASVCVVCPAAGQDFRDAARHMAVPAPVEAGQPDLAAHMAQQSRARVEAAMSAAVLDAIAREPWRAAEILRAAEAAAPEAYPTVARAVAAAFPALAAAQQAGAAPPPPAPPAPPPSPSVARVLAELMSAIATDPGQLESAVAEALAAAPEARDHLLREAKQAFPGFADRIDAAVAGAPRGTAAPLRPTSAAPSAPPQLATPSELAPRRPVAVEGIADPLEEVNRGVLAFNDAVDAVLLRPIAWTYNKLMPDPAILAVRRFFANLRAPVLFANDLLQLELADAATTAGRFGVNSTLGVLGLFEVAEPLGLPPHHADFGQTLRSYGAGPGPYLMIPLIGPATLRDGVGRVADLLLDPLTWLLTPGQSLALTGGQAVVRREEVLKPIDELRASSVDWYAALRSAYYQRRAVELGKVAGAPAFGAEPGASEALFEELEAESESQ